MMHLPLAFCAEYSGWVNTFSDGSGCNPSMAIGSSITATTAACKAACRSTVGCGAILINAADVQAGTCQLFPLSACATPTARDMNRNKRIYLATGALLMQLMRMLMLQTP